MDGNGGNGTDDFGFSALPGGYRSYYDGAFDMPGATATGGVLRPVAAVLGPVLDTQQSRHHRSDTIHDRLLGQVS